MENNTRKLDAFAAIAPAESITTTYLGEPLTGSVYTNSREVCVTYRDARTGYTLALARPVDTPPDRVLNELVNAVLVPRHIL
jgi:hypothetical protein